MYPEIEQYALDPSPENRSQLIDSLEQERFKLTELGISSRVYMYWKQNGLFPEDQDRKWVRLDFFDFFWVQIINDLRDIGLPIERITKVRTQLFENLDFLDAWRRSTDEQKEWMLGIWSESFGIKKEEALERLDILLYKQNGDNSGDVYNVNKLDSFQSEVRFPLINAYILNLLFRGADIKLAITMDGDVTIIYKPTDEQEASYFNSSYYEVLEQGGFQPLIILPLRRYMYMLMYEPLLQERAQRIGLMNDVEVDVVRAIRDGSAKELRIIFGKDGSKDVVRTFTKSTTQAELNDVLDLIRGKKHTKLNFTTTTGKTVLYEYQTRTRY